MIYFTSFHIGSMLWLITFVFAFIEKWLNESTSTMQKASTTIYFPFCLYRWPHLRIVLSIQGILGQSSFWRRTDFWSAWRGTMTPPTLWDGLFLNRHHRLHWRIRKTWTQSRKRWEQCVRDDVKLLGLHSEWAIFRDMWRDMIWGKHETLA